MFTNGAFFFSLNVDHLANDVSLNSPGWMDVGAIICNCAS